MGKRRAPGRGLQRGQGGGPCFEDLGDNPDGLDVNGDPSLEGVGDVLVLSDGLVLGYTGVSMLSTLCPNDF